MPGLRAAPPGLQTQGRIQPITVSHSSTVSWRPIFPLRHQCFSRVCRHPLAALALAAIAVAIPVAGAIAVGIPVAITVVRVVVVLALLHPHSVEDEAGVLARIGPEHLERVVHVVLIGEPGVQHEERGIHMTHDEQGIGDEPYRWSIHQHVIVFQFGLSAKSAARCLLRTSSDALGGVGPLSMTSKFSNWVGITTERQPTLPMRTLLNPMVTGHPQNRPQPWGVCEGPSPSSRTFLPCSLARMALKFTEQKVLPSLGR